MNTTLVKKPVPDLFNSTDTSGLKESAFTAYVGKRKLETVQTTAVFHQDEYWLSQQFAKIPEDFHARIRQEYNELCQLGERAKANNFILNSLDVFKGFDRKRLAAKEHLAQVAKVQIKLFGLDEAAEWASTHGVKVPRFPSEESNLDPTKPNSREAVTARLCNPEWWDKQLTKRYRRDEEAVQIRAGKVCKGVSPYVSAHS